MKSFITIALISAASAIQSEVEHEFIRYITQYGKSYSTFDEYKLRLEQFTRKFKEVVAHNQTESSYQLGFNKMSDWTDAEYEKILTYQPMPAEKKNIVKLPTNKVSNAIDWVTSGAVNPIKDQGQCGSCWAFSSVASMEGAHEIKTGKLLSFSEQQLVDCSTVNYGCNGGWEYEAFIYYQTYAAESEATYPYKAVDGTCKYNSGATTGVISTGYTNVAANDVNQMKAALAIGPLSVAIQANKLSFQLYTSGIFNNASCGINLDHATNVVGWGTSAGTEYWLMRNSWGTSWGEAGYMRLAIVAGNGICGIQMEPLYPQSN